MWHAVVWDLFYSRTSQLLIARRGRHWAISDMYKGGGFPFLHSSKIEYWNKTQQGDVMKSQEVLLISWLQTIVTVPIFHRTFICVDYDSFHWHTDKTNCCYHTYQHVHFLNQPWSTDWFAKASCRVFYSVNLVLSYHAISFPPPTPTPHQHRCNKAEWQAQCVSGGAKLQLHVTAGGGEMLASVNTVNASDCECHCEGNSTWN